MVAKSKFCSFGHVSFTDSIRNGAGQTKYIMSGKTMKTNSANAVSKAIAPDIAIQCCFIGSILSSSAWGYYESLFAFLRFGINTQIPVIIMIATIA